MRKYLLYILIISIFSQVLFTCPFAYAQSHQLADEYWEKAQNLKKQGKYFEAAKMYEKSVHAEKACSSPRIEALAAQLSQAGYFYISVGQYDKAFKYCKEALDINKRLGKEAYTASNLNNIGQVYYSWGQYDKAIKYYEEALDIDKRLGKEAGVADYLNNIGAVYASWGQYDKTIKYYEEALDIDKRLGKEAGVAIRINNIGYVYYSWGQYDKAIKNYEEALDINKRLGKEAYVAIGLSNIGQVYYSWGQYDKAIKNYEEALDILKKQGHEEGIAGSLALIGNVYYSWGQYDKAIKCFEEALAIYKRLGKEAGVAAGLNSIGRVYKSWGQYDKTIKYYEEALAIYQKQGQEGNIVTCLSNFGEVYYFQGQYDKAINYFEEALAISQKQGQEGIVATCLNNIGEIYNIRGQYDMALKYFEEALAIFKRLGQEDTVATALNNIGTVYLSRGKHKIAIKFLTESVKIKEKLRKTASGDIRRDYLASQLGTYQWLVSAYIKDSDISSAFQTIELSRAKLLTERLTGNKSKAKLPNIKEIQKTLGEDTAILVYANVNWESIIQIAITKEEITGKALADKSFVQSSIGKYDKSIRTLLNNQRGITVTKKDNKDKFLSDKTESKSGFDNIINYYRSLLKNPSLQGERGLKVGINKFKVSQKVNIREIGSDLYELLIKPMDAQIKDKTNIIIVPDGILAFVPFETLIDDNGQYLAEKYRITYVQSVGIMELIKEREYKKSRKPLLAFGGAVYDEVSYDVDMIENETQLAYLTKSLHADFDNNRSVSNAYGALGIGKWGNLPGTLNEVKSIKKVIKKADIFTGINVTEKNIKELSRNGTLSEYKVLHFATHGLVVPEMPELSAVVLSQFESKQGMEDGYLRMGEIAKLDINADLVNLSACETGLGKIYGGEGVVGLTQSFLLAGANAVSVSLWQVADESTSRFMVSMYDMVQNKGVSYAEAITEVKRQFINGDFGEEYKAPFYWAPFVYYGN